MSKRGANSGSFKRLETKVCPGCGLEADREAFRYGGQIRRYCAGCYPEQARLYRERNSEHYKKYHRDRNAANPQAQRDRMRKHMQKVRRIVFEHYGGTPPTCACCGEAHYEFLALDHIKGGGEKHRKEFTSGLGGHKTYTWAIKNNFPPIFRVLCHNCNSSLGYFGYCPHLTEGRTDL